MRRRAAQADQIAYSETQMSKKLHPAPVPTDRALQLTNSMAVPQQRLMATDEQVHCSACTCSVCYCCSDIIWIYLAYSSMVLVCTKREEPCWCASAGLSLEAVALML
jgi:hypothetical protein